jgi:hypothetical protein
LLHFGFPPPSSESKHRTLFAFTLRWPARPGFGGESAVKQPPNGFRPTQAAASLSAFAVPSVNFTDPSAIGLAAREAIVKVPLCEEGDFRVWEVCASRTLADILAMVQVMALTDHCGHNIAQ